MQTLSLSVSSDEPNTLVGELQVTDGIDSASLLGKLKSTASLQSVEQIDRKSQETGFAFRMPLSRPADESGEARATKKMRAIGLAIHNHHSAFRQLPPISIKDKDGVALLSWRVRVLPFLGKQQAKLYHQFRQDEPWDSPHNRRLISEMPDIFRIGFNKSGPANKTGLSTVEIPVGAQMVFHSDDSTFSDITDGHENTIMVVEIPDGSAEIWTKPSDGLTVDSTDPSAGIGGHFGSKVLVVMADGSIRFLAGKDLKGTLYSAFTRALGD